MKFHLLLLSTASLLAAAPSPQPPSHPLPKREDFSLDGGDAHPHPDKARFHLRMIEYCWAQKLQAMGEFIAGDDNGVYPFDFDPVDKTDAQPVLKKMSGRHVEMKYDYERHCKWV